MNADADPSGAPVERPPHDGLEAQRVFARVAQSMLGLDAELPTIGRFEVHERIGEGGMGQVYGARDPLHDREIAIKVLRADHRAEADAVSRMHREARALTRLAHPNVVEVYEVGTVDEQVYIAMELLRGQTLGARLQEQRRLSPAQTAAVLGDVCRALQRAHNRGIIHRDLKPANIFLVETHAESETETDEGPRTKVLDFGLAKVWSAGTLDVSTASGTVMGTLHYMSPEQGRDSTAVDHRCDLWAVAIIAYECLVGERPYAGKTMAELAVALLTTAPPIPSEHGDVPAGFDAWFARATAQDVEQRFDSAAALAEALAEALEQPRPTGLERPVRARSRGRGVAVAVAAGALAVGAGCLWWGLGTAPRSSSSTEPAPVSSSSSSAAGAVPVHSKPIPADVGSPEPAVRVPAPALSPTVEVRFTGVPDGAEFWAGDARVGIAPAPAILERGDQPQRVRIEAPGFQSLVLDVVAERSGERAVELRPVASSPTQVRPTPEPDSKSNVDDLEF